MMRALFQEGFHYAIVTDFGLKVTYDMIYKVTVTVPGNYKGKTCDCVAILMTASQMR